MSVQILSHYSVTNCLCNVAQDCLNYQNLSVSAKLLRFLKLSKTVQQKSVGHDFSVFYTAFTQLISSHRWYCWYLCPRHSPSSSAQSQAQQSRDKEKAEIRREGRVKIRGIKI